MRYITIPVLSLLLASLTATTTLAQDAQLLTAEQECPGLFDESDRTGPGPSIATGPDLDLSALAATIPESVDGATRLSINEIPRGYAGHGSPNVVATFEYAEDGTVFLTLIDLHHQCHCSEGMGELMRAQYAQAAGESGAAGELHGNPSLVVTTDPDVGAMTMTVWVADRCALMMSSANAEVALAIADGMDWEGLAVACGESDGE
ncbi:MAG: hypothetical protein KC561_06945 [Myxococcales bacterium]|nr:hypothetical protein [Myxococcales bacterium]